MKEPTCYYDADTVEGLRAQHALEAASAWSQANQPVDISQCLVCGEEWDDSHRCPRPGAFRQVEDEAAARRGFSAQARAAILRTANSSTAVELAVKARSERARPIDIAADIRRAKEMRASAVLPTAPAERKALPLTTGVLDYFPLALAEVARVSKAGNDQHNPGKPLHWDKTKSLDHADCIARHLIDRSARDTDGMRHAAKLCWRALALLETILRDEAV